jgi:hypothetical protein
MKLLKHIAMAALLLTPSANAEDKDWRSQFDISRADLSFMKLTLFNEGKAAGRMEYEWERIGDTYVIKDLSQMEPNILETAKGVIDAETLLPRSIYVDFAMGASKMIIDLGWQGSHMTGSFSMTRENQDAQVREADEKIEAPLRLAVIGMVSALPLEPGYSLDMPWYNSLGRQQQSITLEVIGEELVEAPAGVFDTYKVAIKGGTPENVVYVTKAMPRKIARIDVVGQPIYFLRTE